MRVPLFLILTRLSLAYLSWGFFDFGRRMPNAGQVGMGLFAGCGALCVITLIASCIRRPWGFKVFLALLFVCSVFTGLCFDFFLLKPEDGWEWLKHTSHLPTILGMVGPLIFMRMLVTDPPVKAYFNPPDEPVTPAQ